VVSCDDSELFWSVVAAAYFTNSIFFFFNLLAISCKFSIFSNTKEYLSAMHYIKVFHSSLVIVLGLSKSKSRTSWISSSGTLVTSSLCRNPIQIPTTLAFSFLVLTMLYNMELLRPSKMSTVDLCTLLRSKSVTLLLPMLKIAFSCTSTICANSSSVILLVSRDSKNKLKVSSLFSYSQAYRTASTDLCV